MDFVTGPGPETGKVSLQGHCSVITRKDSPSHVFGVFSPRQAVAATCPRDSASTGGRVAFGTQTELGGFRETGLPTPCGRVQVILWDPRKLTSIRDSVVQKCILT